MPTNHRLFLDQPLAALNLEMMEDLWVRERELAEELANQREPAVELAEQLQAVRRALDLERDAPEVDDQVVTDDPVVDRWEREIAAGGIPDLDQE